MKQITCPHCGNAFDPQLAAATGQCPKCGKSLFKQAPAPTAPAEEHEDSDTAAMIARLDALLLAATKIGNQLTAIDGRLKNMYGIMIIWLILTMLGILLSFVSNVAE